MHATMGMYARRYTVVCGNVDRTHWQKATVVRGCRTSPGGPDNDYSNRRAYFLLSCAGGEAGLWYGVVPSGVQLNYSAMVAMVLAWTTDYDQREKVTMQVVAARMCMCRRHTIAHTTVCGSNEGQGSTRPPASVLTV